LQRQVEVQRRAAAATIVAGWEIVRQLGGTRIWLARG
jgi:hypothetical protein